MQPDLQRVACRAPFVGEDVVFEPGAVKELFVSLALDARAHTSAQPARDLRATERAQQVQPDGLGNWQRA